MKFKTNNVIYLETNDTKSNVQYILQTLTFILNV